MTIEVFRFGEFELNVVNARLLKRGEKVSLPPKALSTLSFLLQQRGRLISKDELLDAVWGHRFVTQSVLKNTLSTLRQILDDDPKTPRFIETVHRLGYRFIADVCVDNAYFRPTTELNNQNASCFVGQEQNLTTLRQLLKKADAGQPQMVFVVGEPGIGKTALLESFRRELPVSIMSGHGQCVEQYGQAEAYLPMLETLNELLNHNPATLCHLLRQTAPTWLAQMPWHWQTDDQSHLPQRLIGASQSQMLREFGEFLVRISHERLVVLLLEDLHWSDHATLDLLTYLARRKSSARWLIIGSYRPGDVILGSHQLKSIHRELGIQGLCSELKLQPLTVDAIARYLQQQFPARNIPTSWAELLHDRTGGLAFFLVQLVETLKMHSPNELTMNLPNNLPEGVEQLLTHQFEQLTPEQQQTLVAASVAGMTFSAQAVATALNGDPNAIESHCEHLATVNQFVFFLAGIDASERYGFRHAFYQTFAYSKLPPVQKTELHRRLGFWLEQNQTQPENVATELALHFERGHEWSKAVTYLKVAAKYALTRRYALHEASQLLRRGLVIWEAHLQDLSARQEDGIDLLLLLALVLQSVAGYSTPELDVIFDRALTLSQHANDTLRTAKSHWGLFSLHYIRMNLDRALHHARQMLAIAEENSNLPDLIGGHVGLSACHVTNGHLEIGLHHARQAILHYDPEQHRGLCYAYVQDPSVLANFFQGQALWSLGRFEQAGISYRNAFCWAKHVQHPLTLCLAYSAMMIHHIDRREPQQVLDQSQAFEDICLEHGLTPWLAMAQMGRGWAQAVLMGGENNIGLIEAGLAAWKATGSRGFETRFLVLLADAHGKVGHAKAGLDALDRAEATLTLAENHFYSPEVYRLRAKLLQQNGCVDVAIIEACFQNAFSIANHQFGNALALRAATDLASYWFRQHRALEAQALLLEVYQRFDESFDTADLQDARTLLDEIANAL